MKTRKILCLLLAAAASIALASCAESKDVSGSSDTNASASTEAITEEVAETEIKDSLPDTDLEGYSFRIAAFSDNHKKTMYVEEMTGNLVDDAVYNKNRTVEDRFNVDIVLSDLCAAGESNPDQVDFIKTEIMSGNDSFDIVQGHDVNMANASLEGNFVNVYEIPHLDFDKPWWPAPTVESLTINGKMYLMSCNLSYVQLRSTRVLYFNKSILNDLSIAYPYEQVYDGSFTLDSLNDIVKACYQDINGDGQTNEGDRYGIVNPKYYYCVLEPFNVEPYVKNSDGELEYSFDLTKNQLIVEKLYNLYFGSAGAITEKAIDYFKAQNSAFVYTNLGDAVSIFSFTDIIYGILPMPKLDESQDQYYGGSTDRPIAVPITLQNLEAAGIVIEAMNAEGYKQVFPAYYEVALKARYADANDDANMIDIVHNNCICSFTYMFGNYSSSYNNMLETLFNAKTPSTDVASYAAKNEKTQIKRVETIMKYYIGE